MRRFLPADLETLNAWRVGHGEDALGPEMIPETGFIEDGVAAGFLFRTESPAVAMLDGFVTNPAAPLRARMEAVARIGEGLAAAAREAGIRALTAFTSSRGIRRLAERHGYRSESCVLLCRRA